MLDLFAAVQDTAFTLWSVAEQECWQLRDPARLGALMGYLLGMEYAAGTPT